MLEKHRCQEEKTNRTVPLDNGVIIRSAAFPSESQKRSSSVKNVTSGMRVASLSIPLMYQERDSTKQGRGNIFPLLSVLPLPREGDGRGRGVSLQKEEKRNGVSQKRK